MPPPALPRPAGTTSASTGPGGSCAAPTAATSRRSSSGRWKTPSPTPSAAVGPTTFDPSDKGHEAPTGGWIRLAEPRPLDAALLVAYADAWPPALFATSAIPMPADGVPTVDLTVHVRSPFPFGVAPDDFVLVVFRTRHVQDGFLEEDGEIWSRDGRLLAHSRQLGVAI